MPFDKPMGRNISFGQNRYPVYKPAPVVFPTGDIVDGALKNIAPLLNPVERARRAALLAQYQRMQGFGGSLPPGYKYGPNGQIIPMNALELARLQAYQDKQRKDQAAQDALNIDSNYMRLHNQASTGQPSAQSTQVLAPDPSLEGDIGKFADPRFNPSFKIPADVRQLKDSTNLGSLDVTGIPTASSDNFTPAASEQDQLNPTQDLDSLARAFKMKYPYMTDREASVRAQQSLING